jgi:hypothetical protein
MKLFFIFSILPFISLGQMDSFLSPSITLFPLSSYIYHSDLSNPYLNEEIISQFTKSNFYYNEDKKIKNFTSREFEKFNKMISKVRFDSILNPKYNYIKVLQATVEITVPPTNRTTLFFYRLSKIKQKPIHFLQIKGTIFSFFQGKYLVTINNKPIYIGNTSRFETCYEYWIRT